MLQMFCHFPICSSILSHALPVETISVDCISYCIICSSLPHCDFLRRYLSIMWMLLFLLDQVMKSTQEKTQSLPEKLWEFLTSSRPWILYYRTLSPVFSLWILQIVLAQAWIHVFKDGVWVDLDFDDLFVDLFYFIWLVYINSKLVNSHEHRQRKQTEATLNPCLKIISKSKSIEKRHDYWNILCS